MEKIVGFFNYIDHLLIVTSTITGCISISSFASLVGIPIGIINSIEVLISKALIDSNSIHDEFLFSKYVKINSVNPLYLIINKVNGYSKEINKSKYLTLVPKWEI